MGKYFIRNTEVAEPDAASAWFSYAQANGIDVPKAISIWEDASTSEGSESRQKVGHAGIRIEPGIG